MTEPVIRPLFARVLLKRPVAHKIGSILLPAESAQRHASLKCEVIAKGPTADPSVRVGSKVLIGKHSGTWLDADGSPVPDVDKGGVYYLCADEDILCEVE